MHVTAVCSADPDRAAQAAARFGAEPTTQPEELARRTDVDLVCVTTPPHLHLAGVEAALEAGKHVLCEKPFAMDAAEAGRMRDLAKAAGVCHLLNFEFRRLPARQRMRALIQEGYLGELRHVHQVGIADFLHRIDGNYGDWWYDPSRGGGWLGAAVSHDIDNLRFLFGEITEVAAQLDTRMSEVRVRGALRSQRSQVDDTALLLLRFDDGTPGALLSGAAGVTRPLAGRLEAYGSRGTLVLEGGRLLGAEADGRLEEISVPEPSLEMDLPDPHALPFVLWAGRIREALQEGTPLTPDFEDGWRNQLVLDAARQAARERRWVSTTEVADAARS
jgi:predicted dehydrogenase